MSRPRIISFYVIGFTLLYLITEVGAYVAQNVFGNQPYSLQQLTAARSAIVAEREDETRLPDTSEAGQESRRRVEMLHPYMGYVVDYNDSRCSGHGFCDKFMQGYENAPLTPRGDDEFMIGVFGGSFAYQTVHVSSEGYLESRLKTLSGLENKRLIIQTIAQGGFKQPQQLMALNWFMSLGAQFDLVINLDGFNEVALPPAENISAGTYPYFPRVWHNRVRATRDVHLLAIYGRIEHEKDVRARRAKRLNESLWRYSVLRNLVWKARDARSVERAAEYDLQARSYRSANTHVRPLVMTGPRYAPESAESMFEDMADFWARSSRQMHAVAQGQGIPYFHFLQPNQYHVDSKPLSDQERIDSYIETHPYRHGVVGGYPLLTERGAAMQDDGIAFFDLTGLFSDNEETLYIDACCHLNNTGYDLVVDAMIESIRPLFRAREQPRQ